MAKTPKKDKWTRFVFTPLGADRAAHGIKYGDDGYLHLCERFYNRDYMRDYHVFSRDFKPGDGGRNVGIDWTGFKEALQKFKDAHPRKPSVFSGKYQHCEEGRELRKRLLHAICREYQHPEALADDLWAFLIQGKPEECRNLISILSLYWNQPNQRPEGRSSLL